MLHHVQGSRVRRLWRPGASKVATFAAGAGGVFIGGDLRAQVLHQGGVAGRGDNGVQGRVRHRADRTVQRLSHC